MENIEDKINKELEKKNIHKKNYIWIFFTLLFTLIAIIYSYATNLGVIAKQTINNNLIAKNQENINISNVEHKTFYHINKESSSQVLNIKEPSSLTIEEDNQTEEIVSTLIIQEDELETKEELLAQDRAMQEEHYENIRIEKANEALEEIEKSKIGVEKIAKKELIVPIKETPSKKEIKLTEVLETKEVEVKVKTEAIITEEKALLANTQVRDTDIIARVIEPKTNFNLNYCYTFKPAVSSFDKSCETTLDDFVKENSSATRYEIIGIIDLEDVKNLSNKGEINQRLLAKNRIISVQKILKEKTSSPISNHFYYLKSELPTRGFVLRAYF